MHDLGSATKTIPASLLGDSLPGIDPLLEQGISQDRFLHQSVPHMVVLAGGLSILFDGYDEIQISFAAFEYCIRLWTRILCDVVS